MDLKNMSISVSLSCMVALGTSFATFSYNQGAQATAAQARENRIVKLEDGFAAVSSLDNSIDLLRQDVGYMRSEFNELKSQTQRMSDDMNAVNLYIAKQQGADEARAQLETNHGG